MRVAVVGALLLACTACGRDEPIEPGVPVRFRPAPSGLTAFGEIPFPSDLYRDGDGNVTIIPGLERVAENHETIQGGLSALDGFGRSTGAFFFVDQAVDAASLPRTWEQATARAASAFIVDVDSTSPRLGTRYPVYAKFLPSLGCISVIPVPGVVLPPGVRHAVVLTTRARAETGGALVADAELVRIATGSRVTAADALYGDALDRLILLGAVSLPSEIAGLAVFTTSQRVRELPELRDRLRTLPEPSLILDPVAAAPYTVAVFGAQAEPTLDQWLGTPEKDETGREWPGGDNPGGIAHDAIGAIASGAFVAPSFLDPVSRHFERDADGAYRIVDASLRIPVTLVIPKAPPPAAGYPVVVNGHGLSNNRGSMLAVANELARAGFAVIGIDDVEHGTRSGIPDEANNYPGGYHGPDGIPDEMKLPFRFFGGFSDFVVVRDNFRQTVLDQCSLVRLVQSSQLDLSGLAPAAGFVPALDPSRIFWSGGSLGGIMGTMTLAVEPELRGGALQVPGASFVQLITTSSAKVAPLVGLIAGGTFGVQGDEPLDEFHPVALLLAAVTEAGDPIGYAPHVLGDPLNGRAPPDVLISYAVRDEVLPNISTVAFIRALGLELATPGLLELPGIGSAAAPVSGNLAGRTAAAVQYSPANHGLGYVRYDLREFLPDVPVEGEVRFPKLPASFQIETPIREHADQLVTFLKTAAAGAGVIEITAPPRDDFDGDGTLDDDDADPLDPKVE